MGRNGVLELFVDSEVGGLSQCDNDYIRRCEQAYGAARGTQSVRDDDGRALRTTLEARAVAHTILGGGDGGVEPEEGYLSAVGVSGKGEVGN